MELPKKLKKSTILETVTEFRFKNRLEIEDVFFIVKSKLDEKGYKYTKTPLLEIPPAIREGDQNLKYATYYIFQKGKYLVNVSPQKISFSNKGFYNGWKDYFTFIVEIYESLGSLFEKWEFDRLSMRYINFFNEIDIFENINIKIEMPEILSKKNENSKSYSSEIKMNDNITLKLQVINNLSLRNEENKVSIGSIVDTDVFLDANVKDYEKSLNILHDTTKEIFFNILKPEFIEKLEPEYK
ncbi:TIGR04255 family protein [Malaciobacter marinus]|jgi:uncharacterized protein (TIGR04255 family)|uniref:TIGR04255 family protein n=1 Tax=Malaciobacter marinus TaxID=505249 RepID=UPI0009A6D3CE|nr:TIGR04255 family protein [Malaciobacter marinus]SKB73911.1 TIGR04255 family protein [Malaciobacter marinus]